MMQEGGRGGRCSCFNRGAQLCRPWCFVKEESLKLCVLCDFFDESFHDYPSFV
jgi:hypothetical protein